MPYDPPAAPGADPLILTLDLGEAFAHFDGLRRRHFPSARHLIPAHATLFHHLPGEEEVGIRGALAALARAQPAPEVTVVDVRFLGRGVAYGLRCDALAGLRARLAREFGAWLTPQDRQGWRPHVTVQNKVAPETARALHAALEAEFAPFRFVSPGVVLWRYLGGPWERLRTIPFGENR